MIWLTLGFAALVVIVAAVAVSRAQMQRDAADRRAAAARRTLARHLALSPIKVLARPHDCGCAEIPAQVAACTVHDPVTWAEIESQAAQ